MLFGLPSIYRGHQAKLGKFTAVRAGEEFRLSRARTKRFVYVVV